MYAHKYTHVLSFLLYGLPIILLLSKASLLVLLAVILYCNPKDVDSASYSPFPWQQIDVTNRLQFLSGILWSPIGVLFEHKIGGESYTKQYQTVRCVHSTLTSFFCIAILLI